MAWANHWSSLSRPADAPTLRVLSLGAGVQSTTLALAAARREVGPMPDCAIFADTKWEPRAVMKHLAWLRTQLPFPVHLVSAGDLKADTLARTNTTGGRYAPVPWHILMPDGSRSMGRRQCTKEYKIAPITKHLRALLGVKKGRRVPKGVIVEQWIGISTDEIERIKAPRQAWIRNRWPLLEADMDRRACAKWLEERQYSAPKSSCLGCPFHSNAEWRRIRDESPDEWAETVAIDRALREGNSRGKRGKEFMHRSCLPLDQAPIDETDTGPDLFGFKNECEGMCGI